MTKATHRWLIEFTQTSLSELRALPSGVRMQVFRKLRSLLINENPISMAGVKKLKGIIGAYRVRSGDYRVLFAMQIKPITHLSTHYKGKVVVEGVKHRSSAYRP